MTTDLGLLAGACCPAKGRLVVGDVKKYWMWVVCDVCCCYHMDGGTVIDYHRDKLNGC